MESKHFKPHALYQAISLCFFSSLFSVVTHADDTVQQLTTIKVLAEKPSTNRYLANKVALAGFGTNTLNKVPASVSVITSSRIEDQQAKLLTDVVKNDASVGDGYAAIGYYPNFVSRGFSLDQASSYLINGNLIRGEQNVALENKEQVEILKGVSAMQSDLSTPSGVVNYVTKRPKEIKSIGLDVDQYGDNTISADFGGFVGAQKQFGYRINLAQQAIRPYVEHSDGKRSFGSVAMDWNISDQSQLQFDLESQRQQQRSVAGYQLLDGTTVPTGIDKDRLLGYQSWSKPVTINSLNSSLKYNYKFNDDWRASLTASHSQVNIDDFSAFPYGYTDLSDPDNPKYLRTFSKNGLYDIYDYRNPNDARRTDQFKAALDGHFQTGTVDHKLRFAIGQTQKKQQQYEDVNEAIGKGNIYANTVDFPQSPKSLGAYYTSLNSKQTALSVQDLIQFTPQWSSLIGGKWVHVNEKAYNADGSENRHTQMDRFLPQLALMYQPWANTNFYASYAKGLADGGEAPWYTENADVVLAPIESKQFELGVKQQVQNFLLTAAIFDLTQDNQYSWLNPQDDKQYFIQQGQQRNRGIELSANGDITENLAMTSSAAWIRTRLNDVDSQTLTGHQTQNSPKLRIATHLSYQVPNIEGLRVLGGFQYSAAKYANKQGTVSVPSYTVFDAGAAYSFKLSGHDTVVRFNIDNLFNKYYWRDTGGYLGDDYLFLGAPRTAKLSIRFNF